MAKHLPGKPIVCDKCKIPGGLKHTPPLVKIGDVYVHAGQCPIVRKARPRIVLPKAGGIIAPGGPVLEIKR